MLRTEKQNQVSALSDAKRMIGLVLLAVAFLMPAQSLAQALSSGESARLAPGDVIQISVPGRPALSSSLTLDSTGKVAVPQIGDVTLDGLTGSEAELVLRQRLRLYDPSIDRVDVTLQNIHAGGMNFFIIGQVSNPGEYTFSEIPSIWELIRAAGGPAENGNMRLVRHIREEGGRTQVSQYDISGLIEGGDVAVIELQPGDTLVIPALLEGVSSVSTTRGVKVFGAVEVPTVVDIIEPTPMLDVLMLAGSPSAESELGKIFWVHDVGDVPQARLVDMKQYLEFGNPIGNPLVYPGDTIRVEYFKESWFRRTLPLFFGLMVSGATVWLAYDRIVTD